MSFTINTTEGSYSYGDTGIGWVANTTVVQVSATSAEIRFDYLLINKAITAIPLLSIITSAHKQFSSKHFPALGTMLTGFDNLNIGTASTLMISVDNKLIDTSCDQYSIPVALNGYGQVTVRLDTTILPDIKKSSSDIKSKYTGFDYSNLLT